MQKNSSIPSLTNNKVYPAADANGGATGGGGGGGNYNQNIVNGIDSNKMVSCLACLYVCVSCVQCLLMFSKKRLTAGDRRGKPFLNE